MRRDCEDSVTTAGPRAKPSENVDSVGPTFMVSGLDDALTLPHGAA